MEYTKDGDEKVELKSASGKFILRLYRAPYSNIVIDCELLDPSGYPLMVLDRDMVHGLARRLQRYLDYGTLSLDGEEK